jgi:aryl-alcohol dehydrogenase
MHCCCGSGFAQASRLNFFPGQSLHGIIQGDAVPQTFIPKLIELYLSGEFPIDKIVRYYDPGAINDAFADAARGETPKPVVLFDQQVV